MEYTQKIKAFIGGDPLDVGLEERLFNYTCVAVFLLSAFATGVNLSLKISSYLSSLTIFITAIGALSFYLSRFRNLYKWIRQPFYFFLYLMAIAGWFFNGGIESPMTFIFIFLLVVVITTSKVHHHAFHLSFILVLMIGLIGVNFFYPEWVSSYKSDQVQFYDLSLILLIVSLLVAINVHSLKYNYDQQKEYAERKSSELKTSLVYASSIQDAFMESPYNLTSKFSDAFMIYLPKDIVSGDFYWYKEIHGKRLLAVVDSSGYGVPGALLSTLSITFLNEISLSEDKIEPQQLLKDLRVKLKLALQQRYDKYTMEGMDIAICLIDDEKKVIKFAGASNPLYRIREGQFTRLKGENLPLGAQDHDRQFDSAEIDFQEKDRFYLFTDGYINQLGGAEGKKYSIARFRELLQENAHLSMKEQKRLLIEKHIDWKGKDYRQIDDLLVFGFEV